MLLLRFPLFLHPWAPCSARLLRSRLQHPLLGTMFCWSIQRPPRTVPAEQLRFHQGPSSASQHTENGDGRRGQQETAGPHLTQPRNRNSLFQFLRMQRVPQRRVHGLPQTASPSGVCLSTGSRAQSVPSYSRKQEDGSNGTQPETGV